MGQLDRISSPDDVRRLTSQQADDLAAEIRTFLVEQVSRTGGHLGPEPRRRRADHRDAPGVRVAAGHHGVRHGPPGLRAQAADRPPRLLAAAQQGRPVRVPQPGGVRARRRRELARLDRAELGRRHRQGQRAAGPRRPARRRGDRRRRPDGRHGLGGAQQHRRRAGPPARHRRQRQRPLLRADHRRPGAPPRHPAHHPGLRERPVLGQAHAAPVRRARPRDLRRAARHEEGHQGRPRAAGHVRGPRHQVRRPGRRARRARRRAGAAQREGVRRAGHRARHHREGPRVRPGRAGRRGPVPRGRQDPPRDRPARRAVAVRVDQRLRRRARARSAVAARTSSRSPPRCSSRSASRRSRRSSRTRVFDVGIAEQHAATSAAGMAFGGLHPVVAVYATFLNRAFDQVLMDVALHKAGVTFVLDRAGLTGDPTARATTACGTWRCSASSPVCGWRPRATRRRCATRCAPRSTSTTPRRWSATRRARSVDPVPAIDHLDGVDVLARHDGPADAQHVLVVGVRRDGADRARDRASCSPRTACASPSSTRGGSCRCPRRSPSWSGTTTTWSPSRTASSTAASGRWWRSGRARRGSARPCRPSASRARSSTTPPASSWSTELRLRPGGHRPRRRWPRWAAPPETRRRPGR